MPLFDLHAASNREYEITWHCFHIVKHGTQHRYGVLIALAMGKDNCQMVWTPSVTMSEKTVFYFSAKYYHKFDILVVFFLNYGTPQKLVLAPGAWKARNGVSEKTKQIIYCTNPIQTYLIRALYQTFDNQRKRKQEGWRITETAMRLQRDHNKIIGSSVALLKIFHLMLNFQSGLITATIRFYSTSIDWHDHSSNRLRYFCNWLSEQLIHNMWNSAAWLAILN